MNTKILVSILLAPMFFTSCFNQSAKKDGDEKTVNDSIEVMLKAFENNPDKIEYEIPILKGTKLRHGVQKRYYSHGSIYSEIPYNRNNREGVAYTYYKAYKGEKPVVWKEQPYVNGELEGICKRYYSDGQLQAEYEYKRGLPAIGLKEYSERGKVINQPTLQLSKTEVGGNIYITAQMSNKTKKVVFYNGDLIDGKYVSKNLKKMSGKDGIGEAMIPITTIQKSITIIAEMTTRNENQYYTAATIRVK